MTTIRLARPGDEPAIHEAHMRSIREVCVKDHGPDEIRGWGYREQGTRWVAGIAAQTVWVVELDGAIRGCAYIRLYEENGGPQAHIHAMYLTPEVLGQGLGRKLMEFMLEKARASGVKTITLDSTITAHEFYKRFGFEDSGPMKWNEIGGHPVRGFPMKLSL